MKKNNLLSRILPRYSGTHEERHKKNMRLHGRYLLGWAGVVLFIGTIFNNIPYDLFQNPVFDALASTTPAIKNHAYATLFPQAVTAVWIAGTYLGPIALIHLLIATQPYEPRLMSFGKKFQLFLLSPIYIWALWMVFEHAVLGSFFGNVHELTPADGILSSGRGRFLDRTFHGAMLYSYMGTTSFIGAYFCILNVVFNRIKLKLRKYSGSESNLI